MATPVSYNGQTYLIPSVSDQNWSGTNGVDGFLISLAQNSLQKTGGLFSLSSDLDFGPTAGIKTMYLKSGSAGSPPNTGFVRLNTSDVIAWKNNALDDNLLLGVNDSDQLTWNDDVLLTTTGTIADSKALITDGSGSITTSNVTAIQIGYLSGVASAVHGDSDSATLTNKTIDAASNTLSNISNSAISSSAAIAYSKLALTGSVVDADIASNAAIARSKVAAGTASHVLINDGSGNVSSEAQLAKSRGGAGADMSSVTFPSSGTIATTVGTHEVWVDSGNGHGSTNNKIRRFTNTRTNVGTAITYADSSSLGATFTINEDGLYSISYTDFMGSATCQFGISRNSTQLTTSISGITATDQMIRSQTTTNCVGAVSVVLRLSASDVIRAHTDGTPDGTSTGVRFRIIKICA